MPYEYLKDIAIADIAFRAWGKDKDSELLLLRPQQVKIEQKDTAYYLVAIAQGEELDPERHHQRVDVKAVTLHRFQLEPTPDGWTALVILDI